MAVKATQLVSERQRWQQLEEFTPSTASSWWPTRRIPGYWGGGQVSAAATVSNKAPRKHIVGEGYLNMVDIKPACAEKNGYGRFLPGGA